MINIIDSLLITMGLDGSDVDKGMMSVEQRLARGVKNITSNILAPLAGAFAFGKLISQFLGVSDALGKLSMQLRADTRDIQGWADAVDASGGDANALKSTLTGLEAKLKDAKLGLGGGEFRMLGLNIRDANGGLKTSVDILKDLSRIADTANPDRFEKLTQKLGVDLGTIRLLKQGSEEVDKLVAKYRELAYTQKDADTAREFNVTMGDLNKTFQATAAIGLRVILPVLTWIGDKLRVGVAFLRKHESFVMAFVVGLAVALTTMLMPALSAVAGAAWAAIAPFLPLLAVVAGVALLIDDLWTYIEGGESALGDFWAIFGTGEEIAKSLGDAWEELKKIGAELFETLSAGAQKLFKYFGPVLGSLGNVIKNALKLLKTLFTGNFDEVLEAFKDLWNSVGDLLYKAIKAALELVWDLIKSAVDKIKSWLPKSPLAEYAERVQADKDAAAQALGNMTAVALESSNAALNSVPAARSMSSSVSNSSETTVNVGGIHVASTDPKQAAVEVGNAVQRMVSLGNRGVRQ